MGAYRTVLAFLITPLISPIAGLLVYGAHTGAFPPVYQFRSLFRIYGLLAYLITAIFGIPAFLLLRSSGLGGKLSAAACGAVISFATGYILFALVPDFFTSNNTEGYITWALTGAVSGVVFWVIATYGKPEEAVVKTSPDSEI